LVIVTGAHKFVRECAPWPRGRQRFLFALTPHTVKKWLISTLSASRKRCLYQSIGIRKVIKRSAEELRRPRHGPGGCPTVPKPAL
jgi:hypothetical protein